MATQVEPRYIWTFSRRSFIIRYYRWLYKADEDHLTFCTLFWGMVSTPITLPVRLVILVFTSIIWCFMMLVRGVAWVGGATGQSPPLQAVKRANRAKAERVEARARALRQALLRRETEYLLANDICYAFYGGQYQGPKRKAPSVPSLIAAFVARRADKTALYFQERPQIGRTADVAMGWVGKFFVRFVFYPLMVAVPLASLAFVIWLGDQHSDGIGAGFSTAWDSSTHGLAVGTKAAWEPALIAIGLGLALISLILFVTWMVGQSGEDALHATRDPIVVRAVDWLFVTPVEKSLMGIAWVFEKLWQHVIARIGRGIAGTGTFLVMGHHAVKTRTCPRIEITED
jgi:hypothetical protein